VFLGADELCTDTLAFNMARTHLRKKRKKRR